jgi:hypothetical protein
MQFRSVSWTPDSKHVTFNSTIAKGGERAQWLLPIDGGAPRKIDTGSVAVSSFRFNPVTGQVLFSPDNQPEYDTWTMENFLSPPARH